MKRGRRSESSARLALATNKNIRNNRKDFSCLDGVWCLNERSLFLAFLEVRLQVSEPPTLQKNDNYSVTGVPMLEYVLDVDNTRK